MLRLCSHSSRPLSGEICFTCTSREGRGTVKVAVMEQKSAEAIVGVGRRFQASKRLETSPVEQSGSLTPPKGRTKKGEEPQ